MDLLVGSGMSILCFIALRMITQYTDVSMAIAENRRIIHELCSHSERRKSTDYFQRTVMSAFLLRILQKADYFGRRTSESGNGQQEKNREGQRINEHSSCVGFFSLLFLFL